MFGLQKPVYETPKKISDQLSSDLETLDWYYQDDTDKETINNLVNDMKSRIGSLVILQKSGKDDEIRDTAKRYLEYFVHEASGYYGKVNGGARERGEKEPYHPKKEAFQLRVNDILRSTGLSARGDTTMGGVVGGMVGSSSESEMCFKCHKFIP